MERRLVAIMAADVVGYSKLMAENEAGTLTALKAYREDVFDPEVALHGGRIVKLMGDGVLVEFASAVQAVECGLAVQSATAAAGNPLRLRIGINLGDVMIDGDDIYGDGVNVAARLEAVAEPGGICVAAIVHDQVRRKVGAEFVSLGRKQLKNIAEPIEVWLWSPGGHATPSPEPLALPDKPSIVVLPFSNISGEQEQEYFADGMTEDIITGLSRCRWLFVIARNSSFAYKGAATDVRTVGRELGVRYVLEGSVRKAANRVRITAQLIDAVDGRHLWADRWDRLLEDIFELQDEITATIVGTLEPELGVAELTRVKGKPIDNLDAWDCYLRARWHVRLGDSAVALQESIRLCEQAIAISPDMACAHAELVNASTASILFRYTDDRAGTIQRAFDTARRAVRLDNNDSVAHSALGRVYDLRGQFEDAVEEHRIALALNPNSSVTHLFLGSTYVHAGNPALALPALEQAARLSPRDPRKWLMHMLKGFALSQLGRHKEAIEALRASVHADGGGPYWPWFGLAIVLAHSGDVSGAASAMTMATQPEGLSSIGDLDDVLSSFSEVYREYLVIGARLAGLPA